jgi:hypothetical protein
MDDLEQQLDLGPQPNFNSLIQHVNAAMVEVAHIPNLPLARQSSVIVQLLRQIQATFGEMQGTIQEMQGDIRQIRGE